MQHFEDYTYLLRAVILKMSYFGLFCFGGSAASRLDTQAYIIRKGFYFLEPFLVFSPFTEVRIFIVRSYNRTVPSLSTA